MRRLYPDELRARVGRVNYRVLYFFHGRRVAVLTSGCTKEGEVGDADIDRAVRFKDAFRADPKGRIYRLPQPKASTAATPSKRKRP